MNYAMTGTVLLRASRGGCCLLFCLLAVGAWAETGTQPAGQSRPPSASESGPLSNAKEPDSRLEVTYKERMLSVTAEKAEITVLLKKVAEAAGLPIEIGAGVTGTVSVTFIGLSIEEGISKILSAYGEKNLSVEYARKPGAPKDAFVIEKIQILRGSNAAVTQLSAEERRAAREKREKEYREFFDMMDRDRNKIARAIKEYQDPDTSERKRIKLRSFLRGTSIDKLEDKKLIKGALLDPKVTGALISDLQMALMHAIQDHPEESDKDFILELLQRDDNRVGWLYYAMVNAWDPRYIPYLMQGARQGSSSDIEILGAMQVKEALPLLEDIILKKIETNGPARNQARMSWRQMTGKDFLLKKETKP